MPNPKYLIELKRRAEKTLNQDPPDGMTASVAAWIFWEAVRRRLLVMASKREGAKVDHAKIVLMKERIDHDRFAELYRKITLGQSWEQSMPMAARKLWPKICRFRDVRRRIINGTSRVGDAKLQAFAWDILRFVNALREHPVGDPLKKIPKGMNATIDIESLKDRIY